MDARSAFDLQKAVAAWRQFHARRVFTREDLDELEQHLRDHAAHLARKGMDEEAAFRTALQGLGDVDGGEAEYRKVRWGKLRRRHQINDELTWRLAMLRNYARIAVRNLLRQKGYSFINVSGLAIGVACCLLIALYVAHELSYDRHYEHADRIYRIVTEYRLRGEGGRDAFTTTPVAEALLADYPEIEQAARIAPDLYEAGSNLVRTTGNAENRYEDGFVYADPTFLDIFRLPMVAGERATALAEPFTVVLTERKARQLFPEGQAVGQSLILNDDAERPFVVTGVTADLPSNTHLQFDYLLSMEGLAVSKIPNWGFSNYATYVRLAPGTNRAALEAKLPAFLKKYRREDYEAIVSGGGMARFILQPVAEIHLHSDDIQGYWVHGDIQYVWLFGAVAVFVLVIAGVNFVNLTTARSADRAREIGMRKVLGSHRRQLVAQFLAESVMMCLLAFGLGLALARLLLPVFNGLAGQPLALPWHDARFYPALLAAAVLLGLLAGVYPAFVLSTFAPLRVLKGRPAAGGRGGTLRSALVVFQFATSIVLIAGSLVVWRQMDFIRHKDLGFDREQVLVVEDTYMLGDRRAAFKEALRGVPAIRQVSVSSFLPVSGYQQNYTGAWLPGSDAEETDVSLAKWYVDPEYVHTMGMTIVAGRDFSEDLASDSAAIILNRKAVAMLGLDDPIGKQVCSSTYLDPGTGEILFGTYTVIGVVDDFHFKSLKDDVEGLSLVLGDGGTTIVKAGTADLARTLDAVQDVWKAFAPNQPFRYSFLDDRFAQMYAFEERAGRVFAVFTGLAILIACLGLFGLASFTAESRTREIGIRKVMGASVSGVVVLLSKDFVKLVGLAFVVAAPVAYVGMQRWLDHFTYRTELSWQIFALAGLSAVGVALLTVSYQAIRAAVADPVESLRHE